MRFIIVDVVHVPDILVVGKPLGNEFPMVMVDFIKFDYFRCSTRYLMVGKHLVIDFLMAMVDFN